MRAYAQIVPTFWVRGSGKRLRGKPHAQLLALYLMTCPAANMIGLYYLPLATICHETGLSLDEAREAFAELGEIAQYDEADELVWIPEAAKHQIGETLAARDKRRPAMLRDLSMVGDHPFADAFVEKYCEAYCLEMKGHRRGIEGASKGHPMTEKPPDPDPAPDPDLASERSDPPDRSPTARATPPDGRPLSLDAALVMPVQARARAAVEFGDVANWSSPQAWPEVVAIANAVAEGSGRPVGALSSYARDAGVRAVVGLLADGWEPAETARLARVAAGSAWWRERRAGLSQLTAEVLRRAMPETPPAAAPAKAADPDANHRRLHALRVEHRNRLTAWRKLERDKGIPEPPPPDELRALEQVMAGGAA